MIALTLDEIAAAVGGTLADVESGTGPGPDGVAVDRRAVTGEVVVDSRDVRPGALFVAVPGERVDGHEFAKAAVAAGAIGVLASRPVGVPAVIVPDTVAALGRLARAVADRLPATIVAVTGSSGKTSTKDLLAALLTRLGPTVAAPGSFNNEIGLPLTVLGADQSSRFLVLEMGARGVGHIRRLCQTAPPRIGVVLNVGSAHLGEFGSRETIARAKGELVEALPPAERGGVAVLNADDPLVRAMSARTAARVITVGQAADAELRADDVLLDARGRPTFTLEHGGQRVRVGLRLVGEHHVGNALAAAAVAHAGGLSLDGIAEALGAAEPVSRWRMEVVERPDGVTVVNDAYNANPESMRAALKALVAMAGQRRTWAVLGAWRDLEKHRRPAHDRVGRQAVRLNVNRLVVVGAEAKAMHLGAGMEGSWDNESTWVPGVEEAIALLREQVKPGDVVLVKASRAAGLERIAEALLAEPPTGSGSAT